MRIAFARASAPVGVLGSIAAVVFLLAGLGTAVVDSLADAATSGVRQGLAAASGVDGAARWQIRISRDPEAQADAAASVLDRMLQLPHEFVQSLQLHDRVRLALEPDHVGVWPGHEGPDAAPRPSPAEGDPDAGRRARRPARTHADEPADTPASEASEPTGPVPEEER